jgi:hypothetical protein
MQACWPRHGAAGVVRQGSSRLVLARRGRHGPSRFGTDGGACQGCAWLGRPGLSRRVKAWSVGQPGRDGHVGVSPGSACVGGAARVRRVKVVLGTSRRVRVWPGLAGVVGSGPVWCGNAWLGWAGTARHVGVWCVSASAGADGLSWFGSAWHCEVRQVRQVSSRQGRLVGVWQRLAGLGRQVKVLHGASGRCRVRRARAGTARCGRRGQSGPGGAGAVWMGWFWPVMAWRGSSWQARSGVARPGIARYGMVRHGR